MFLCPLPPQTNTHTHSLTHVQRWSVASSTSALQRWAPWAAAGKAPTALASGWWRYSQQPTLSSRRPSACPNPAEAAGRVCCLRRVLLVWLIASQHTLANELRLQRCTTRIEFLSPKFALPITLPRCTPCKPSLHPHTMGTYVPWLRTDGQGVSGLLRRSVVRSPFCQLVSLNRLYAVYTHSSSSVSGRFSPS